MRVALSLSHAFLFLECEKSESSTANRQQLMGLTTRCDRQAIGWGHIISGDIYPSMRSWLSRLAGSGTSNPLASVSEAMEEVYGFLDPDHAGLWKGMYEARLHASGRFILECPGNACDVSIYPDQDYGPEYEYPTTFSCHNLDGVRQQLTLLAGLAALHVLAEVDLG